MHHAIEFLMLAITFASMAVLGSHLLYQYHGMLSIPEEDEAHSLLNSIELILSKDDLARLSDEYRLYNPSRFISYDEIRDRVGKNFRISLNTSAFVRIEVLGRETLVRSSLTLNGNPLTRAEARLVRFSKDGYSQLVGETDATGNVRFNDAPSYAVCVVHDEAGNFGFAVYNMERAKAFIENETVYLKQNITQAFVVSPFGVIKVDLVKELIPAKVFVPEYETYMFLNSFSLKPYSHLYPLIIVFKEGNQFYYANYPHLFSQGYAKGRQRAFDILKIGNSRFLLMLEL